MEIGKIKLILSVFLIAIFMLMPLTNTHADYWGANNASTIMKQMMERIAQMIRDFMMGMMKQMAVQNIVSMVDNAISGGSGGDAMFITDWQSFLVSKPAQLTSVYMNDFFSRVSGGKGSSLNYTSAGGSGKNLAGNISGMAQRLTRGSAPKTTIQQYMSGPEDMFKKKNMIGFNAAISNPANNPAGLALMGWNDEMNELEKNKTEAQIKAIAYQGYKAIESGGKVATPGSTIKDIQSQNKDLGNKALASATSLPEIITSLVTRVLSQTLSQGIGSIQTKIQKNVSKSIQINSQIKKLPNMGSSFKSSY